MKRLLSIALALCLLAALLPAPAAATGPDSPALAYRFVRNDNWEYSVMSGDVRTTLTGSMGRSNYFQFYYCYTDGSGLHETPISCDGLTVSEGAPFTASSLGETYTELRFTGFGDGTVSYTPAGGQPLTIPVTVDLPPVGFYSSQTASRSTYLSQWNYNGTNTTVYLINRDCTLTSITAPNQSGVSVSMVSGNCYAITMDTFGDLDYLELHVEGEWDGGGMFNDNPGIPLRDVRPALVYRRVMNNNGNYSVNMNGSTQTAALTGAPGRGDFYQFYYRYTDGSGLHETPINCSSLTVSEGAPFTASPLGETYTELRFTAFGSGTVNYTPSGGQPLTLPVTVGLPDIGFYSSQAASQDAYLEKWDYDGTNNTIYLINRAGTFTTITDARSSGAAIDYTPGDSVAAITLDTVGSLNYLELHVEGEWDGGGTFNNYSGIPLLDVRPALVYRYVSCNNGVYSVMGGAPSHSISAAPGQTWTLRFYSLANGAETPVSPNALTFNDTANNVRLFDHTTVATDYVQLDFAAFGTGGSISYTPAGGQPLTVTVTVGLPDIGFYSSDQVFDESTFLSMWDYDENHKTVYLVSRIGAFTSITDSNNTGARITIPEGSSVAAVTLDSVENRLFLSLTAQGNMTGGGTFDWSCNIQVSSQLAGLTLVQESLEASMIDPAPDYFFTGEYSRADVSPIPFTYEGQPYYIGVAWYSDHGGIPVDGGSEGYLPGEQDFWHFHVGFWTKQGADYHQVDEALYATLYSQFENLRIDLLRGRECTNRSPAVYRGANSRMTLATNSTTVGYWVPKLTGTAKPTVTLSGGGRDLLAYGIYYCHDMSVNNQAAPASITSLNEVSEFFQAAVDSASAQIINGDSLVFKFTIPYKAEGYDGEIVIPDALQGDAANGFNCWYDVIGASGPNGEKLTIRGRIIANSGRTRLRSINFVGTGDLDDPTNVCGSGKGDIRGENCIFSQYSCAMKCTQGTCLKWGFDRCVFQDNGTAIYVGDTTGYGGGDCEMYDSTFHRNRIALELAAFPPRHSITSYLVVRCKFIDNTCDVKNTSGRAFFMPKNFFVHRDGSGAYQAGQAVLCPNSTSRVSFYPVALQTGVANGIPGTAFTDVIPDTDFTLFDYFTDPAPSVALGFTYSIPIGALNKVFDVFGEQFGENAVSETHYFWIFGKVNP